MYNISENITKQERWYVLLKEKLKKKKTLPRGFNPDFVKQNTYPMNVNKHIFVM